MSPITGQGREQREEETDPSWMPDAPTSDVRGNNIWPDWDLLGITRNRHDADYPVSENIQPLTIDDMQDIEIGNFWPPPPPAAPVEDQAQGNLLDSGEHQEAEGHLEVSENPHHTDQGGEGEHNLQQQEAPAPDQGELQGVPVTQPTDDGDIRRSERPRTVPETYEEYGKI